MTKLYNMYFNMKCNLKENLNNKRGQGMVEYVLIIALIAIVAMVALSPLGAQIKVKFNEVVTKLGGTAAE
jgi:pilus assembly protein Flp/PilA